MQQDNQGSRRKKPTVALSFLMQLDLAYLEDYTGKTANQIVAGLLSAERNRIEFQVEKPEINPVTCDETPMEQWQRDTFRPELCK